MGPFEGLVILFGLGFALLGPIGFIVALICLGKLGTLSRELENLRAELRRLRFRQDAPPPSPQPQPQSTPQPVQSIPVEPVPQPIAPVTIEPAPQNETPPVPAEQATIDILVQKYAKPQPQPAAEPVTPVTSQPAEPQPVIRKGLEQQIGTQWILVAGIVCVIAAVGFILKHAIDEAWLGPWARVSAVAAGGIVAFCDWRNHPSPRL
jgi:uncharacterized membrane protein